MGHDHAHRRALDHGSDHATGRAGDRRRLRVVLAITATVLVVELVGAYVTGSLALLADAGHMATDVTAVLLALGASYVAARGGGPRSTFGLHRAEVLAALLNALVLLGVCAYLAYAGVARLLDPGEIRLQAGPMVAFAAVGLLANLVAVLVLRGSTSGSLNMRGAANEVLADALGSVLALAAGVVVWTTGFERADPLASLLIAVMIAPRSLMLLRDSVSVLLEIAPPDLDLDDVRHHVEHVRGVVDVHDLHAWTITSGIPSLSAHVTVTDEALAERGVGPVLDELCACVAEHFGVRHATFQVEPVSHGSHEDLGEVH